MKNIRSFAIVCTILAGFAAGVMAEPLINTAPLYEKLRNATAKVLVGYGHCTAFKIAERTYMTAGHCVRPDPGAKIENAIGIGYHFQTHIERASRKKANGNPEDWGIIHTSSDDSDVKPLELSCGEVLYPGQYVAYYGYSGRSRGTLGIGRITTLEQADPHSAADFSIAVAAAPGASGSAIVSLDSGKVIGILTEGIRDAGGFYMVGVESVENTPQCKTFEDPRMLGGT